MIDELRENLERAEWLLDMLADIGSHAELEAINSLVAAARAHLGCSTITDEQVEAMNRQALGLWDRYQANPQHYTVDEIPLMFVDGCVAALEAAARVGTEK